MPYPVAAVRGKNFGTPWTPTALGSALVLWLKADVGLYQERTGASATTPAAVDGDPVGSWLDQSDNGFHFTAPSDSARPTLKLAIQNGRAVIRGDRTDDTLTRAWTAQVNAGYALAVMARRRAIADAYEPLVRMTPDNTLALQREGSGDGTAPSKLEAFASTGTLYSATPATNPDTDFHSYLALYDGAALSIYKDGAVWGGPIAVVGTLNSSASGQTMRLWNEGSINWGDYDIGEVILTTTGTAAAVANLSSYLRSRWGTP